MALNHLVKDIRFMDHESDPEWIWQDDAACLFSDPNLFDLNALDPKSQAVQKFKAAQKICSTCPVRDMCEETATQGDLEYSVRGGKLPLKFNPVSQGRPRTVSNGLCLKGHDNWVVRPGKRGGRRCATCHSEESRARRKAKNPDGIDPTKPRRKGEARGKKCRYGHDEWVPSKRGVAWFRCPICKREVDTKNQAIRRKAAKVAS